MISSPQLHCSIYKTRIDRMIQLPPTLPKLSSLSQASGSSSKLVHAVSVMSRRYSIREEGMKAESSGRSKQGTVSPCAACKLLRRRCADDCIFSPHFPSDQPQKFAIVHKVFGASNVSKMLQELPEHQRSDAVSSMVYEAHARLRDPVYGCVGAISTLQQQVDVLQNQLALAQAEVVNLRLHDQFNPSTSPNHAVLSTSPQNLSSPRPGYFPLDIMDQTDAADSFWSSQ